MSLRRSRATGDLAIFLGQDLVVPSLKASIARTLGDAGTERRGDRARRGPESLQLVRWTQPEAFLDRTPEGRQLAAQLRRYETEAASSWDFLAEGRGRLEWRYALPGP
jgi:hypothetical protein